MPLTGDPSEGMPHLDTKGTAMAKHAASGGSRALNPWRVAGWGLAALLLLLPLVAMRFTAEVNWTGGDFVFAAMLIGGVGGAAELAVRATRSRFYRAGCGLLLAATFLIVWLNAAVGMIGDEHDPRNLLYAGVLMLGLGFAIGGRFRPAGMARAAIFMAVAQALVGIVGVVTGSNDPPGAAGQVVLNGGFVAVFAGAAWLFRRAAHEPADARPR